MDNTLAIPHMTVSTTFDYDDMSSRQISKLFHEL